MHSFRELSLISGSLSLQTKENKICNNTMSNYYTNCSISRVETVVLHPFIMYTHIAFLLRNLPGSVCVAMPL